MRSRLYHNDIIVNAERKFGSAPHYHAAIMEDPFEGEHVALFTAAEVSAALARGEKNPEDAREILAEAASHDMRMTGFLLLVAVISAGAGVALTLVLS